MKLKARIRASLEDFEQEGTGVVSDIEAESADNTQADIAAVDEAAANATEIADSVQEAGDDIDTLEETATVLEETADNGGATAAEISVIAPATEAIFAKYGFKPVFNLSVEAYSTESSRIKQTQISVEGIKDVANTLKDWIINAFVWLGKTIVQGAMAAYAGVKGLKDKFKKTQSDLKEVQTQMQQAGVSDADVQEAVKEVLDGANEDPTAEEFAAKLVEAITSIGVYTDGKEVRVSMDNIKTIQDDLVSISLKNITIDDSVTRSVAEGKFADRFKSLEPLSSSEIKKYSLDTAYEWRIFIKMISINAIGVLWKDGDKKVPEKVLSVILTDKQAANESYAVSTEDRNGLKKLYAALDKTDLTFLQSLKIARILKEAEKDAWAFETLVKSTSAITFKNIKDSILQEGQKEGESFLKKVIRVIKNIFIVSGRIVMNGIRTILYYFKYVYQLVRAYIAAGYYVVRNKVRGKPKEA